MTLVKKDFFGKEVADAIKKACDELGVPQEQLDIEVIETGSTGIFGLIRKKARIRAQIKEAEPSSAEVDKIEEKEIPPLTGDGGEKSRKAGKKEADSEEAAAPESAAEPDLAPEPAAEPDAAPEPVSAVELRDQEIEDAVELDEDEEVTDEPGEELAESDLELIKNDLTQLLGLMGYPSPVEVSAKGSSVLCHVGDEFEDKLTGHDGKTLDSIQYLLRKIVARKIPHRLRLTVDVGNYREKRLDELRERALELAVKVKTNGKTQVIPALSPSERRVIHMSLQDDKEIRSRSVGDGLFKKILIYKPGKGSGKSGGRRRGSSRGRKGQNSRKKSE